MKKCTICKDLKEFTEFNERKRSSDGLQSACKNCNAKHSKIYYKNKTEQHKQATGRRRKLKRQELKSKIYEIKTKYGCQICEEKNAVCLDFHHFNPKIKIFDLAISSWREMAWTTIASEINKCVCVCANCHRKIHAGLLKVTENMLCHE